MKNIKNITTYSCLDNNINNATQNEEMRDLAHEQQQ